MYPNNFKRILTYFIKESIVFMFMQNDFLIIVKQILQEIFSIELSQQIFTYSPGYFIA